MKYAPVSYFSNGQLKVNDGNLARNQQNTQNGLVSDKYSVPPGEKL